MKKTLTILILTLVTGICAFTSCNSKSNDNVSKETPIDQLKNYIIEHGTISNYKKTDDSGYYDLYKIEYDSEIDDIIFSCVGVYVDDESDIINESYPSENRDSSTTIHLDYKSTYSFVKWSSWSDGRKYFDITANLDKSIFSKSNNTMYDINITDWQKHFDYYPDTKNLLESRFKREVATTLNHVEELLKTTNIGITLNDLGYSNY